MIYRYLCKIEYVCVCIHKIRKKIRASNTEKKSPFLWNCIFHLELNLLYKCIYVHIYVCTNKEG